MVKNDAQKCILMQSQQHVKQEMERHDIKQMIKELQQSVKMKKMEATVWKPTGAETSN